MALPIAVLVYGPVLEKSIYGLIIVKYMEVISVFRHFFELQRTAERDLLDDEVRSLQNFIMKVDRRGNAAFVLGLWTGFGDICLEMAYWEDLKNKYPGYLFYFAIPEDKRWLLSLYRDPAIRVIPISYALKKKLENPFLFRAIQKQLKGTKLLYGKIACRTYLMLRGDLRIGMPLLKCFRHSLSLPSSAKPKPIPYWQKGIVRKKKKAIMNLYSNSLFMHGSPAFPALYDALIEEGYEVTCNMRGVPNRQCAISKLPIEEFQDLCAECDLLVSIRSGICDLALETGIDMLIVYPMDKKARKAFTMKQWGRRSQKIVEVFEKEAIESAASLIGTFLPLA